MADYSSVAMVEEIIDSLKSELSTTDDQFDAALLTNKVVKAYRDVRTARKYPSYYSEEEIEADMENYQSQVQDIALYDYNTIGIEWQKTNKEKQVSREFIRRSSLFGGIVPLSSIV